MHARSWQRDAIAFALETPGHRLVQAPPGTGKSYVGYAVAARWLERSTCNRVFWAVPSIALCEQAHAVACRYVRTPSFICRAATRAPRGARFIVTTHQSATRFLDCATPRDLLVFDESHHANQNALTNYATCGRHTECLGLSASPWSPGCERAFPTRWIYPLSAALADGALLPLIVHAELPKEPAPHSLHFVASVDDARLMGTGADVLSFVQGDRIETLRPWLRGQVRDLYVCGRLAEGYDVPECARVVIHRQTRSPIWIYQAVGRALRRKPNKIHGHAYGICGDTQAALQHALGLADGYPARLTGTTHQEGNDHVQRTGEIHKDRHDKGQEPAYLGNHLHPGQRSRDQAEEAQEGRRGA